MNRAAHSSFLCVVAFGFALRALIGGATAFGQRPAFYDDFETGRLDLSKWIPSNWKAPGSVSGVNEGRFTPDNLDFSHGLLCIRMTQELVPNGVRSTGGEIQSRAVFGYGTYDFVMRAATTSRTPDGEGDVVSGGDSGAFTFINNSQTEIDIEFLGQTPGHIWLTNWVNPNPGRKPTLKQFSNLPVATLAERFHKYTIVWAPGKVVWYIDGSRITTHTQNVPAVPAHIMINNWGTNSELWGGRATIGVTRYLYVKSVRFTAWLH
jgi:endo-1,3-1,4-beta-glycanase ExoK